jgi:hypothetical protein
MKRSGYRVLVLASMAIVLGCSLAVHGQDSPALQPLPVVDTLVADTVRAIRSADTGSIPPALLAHNQADTGLAFFNQLHPLLPVDGSIVYRIADDFRAPTKDHLFYLLAGVLLLLGVVRMAFAKYFSDLLRIFSQTAIRQKALREQLLQNKLASMLLNVFFCFSAGTFLYLLALHKKWQPASETWWPQLLLFVAFVAAVYLVKYATTQLSGWLFGLRELADTYTFMVFLVNKMIGIMLLPAIIALALGASDLQAVLVVGTLFGLGFLFIYRYILAIPLLRQHVKIIPFHFFLYFCAFEIVPVLVIYKWMLLVISQ